MLVKNSSQWCVVVTKKCSTTSSARSWAPLHPPAAAVLAAVVVAAGALDVPAAGDGDDHLLFGDQVFDAHVAVEAEHDLGAAVVAELGDDLGQLVGDDLALLLRAGEDRLVVGDLELELGEAILDLLALEGGQPAQLQGEDRVGLQLVDLRAA